MEKLELRHLAPYLPYGLKFLWKGEPDGIWTMVMLGDTKKVDNSVHLLLQRNDESQQIIFRNTKLIKPLLLPLSELTDEHARSCGCLDLKGFIEGIENGFISYMIFEDLVSNQWDVFNLIPFGLAINKLTL
jgi:hypothetical protein